MLNVCMYKVLDQNKKYNSTSLQPYFSNVDGRKINIKSYAKDDFEKLVFQPKDESLVKFQETKVF